MLITMLQCFEVSNVSEIFVSCLADFFEQTFNLLFLFVKMSNKNKPSDPSGIYLTLIKVFHLVAAIQFCFAVYYDCFHVHAPASVLKSNGSKFGGKFKFLTFIDGVMSDNSCKTSKCCLLWTSKVFASQENLWIYRKSWKSIKTRRQLKLHAWLKH